MLLLLQYTLIFASILTLVALGGCFSEHSGVINLGLEGIMVVGALGGALMMRSMPAGSPAIVIVLLTLLAAVLFGVVLQSLRRWQEKLCGGNRRQFRNRTGICPAPLT